METGAMPRQVHGDLKRLERRHPGARLEILSWRQLTIQTPNFRLPHPLLAEPRIQALLATLR